MTLLHVFVWHFLQWTLDIVWLLSIEIHRTTITWAPQHGNFWACEIQGRSTSKQLMMKSSLNKILLSLHYDDHHFFRCCILHIVSYHFGFNLKRNFSWLRMRNFFLKRVQIKWSLEYHRFKIGAKLVVPKVFWVQSWRKIGSSKKFRVQNGCKN